jgi:hypothetical protein
MKTPPASFWYTFAVITTCTILYYYGVNVRVVEPFKQRFRFLLVNDARTILQQDRDGFIRHMREIDLRARRSLTSDEYMAKALASVAEFSREEEERLVHLCRDIDNSVRTEQWLDKWGVDGVRLAALPWTFMKIVGEEYEKGLPHTRPPDVVCVPLSMLAKPDRDVKMTLLHEKVHVYQRRYLNEIQHALSKGGYQRIRKVCPSDTVRANPDTWSDFYVYRDPQGQNMVVTYTSANPSSIVDTQGSPLHEHPFEKMAFDIAKAVVE